MAFFLSRTGFAVVVAVSLASSACKLAQGQEDLHGLKVREVHPVATPTPFPLDAQTRRVQSLQFLAPAEMSAADRELVAANAGEIARRAGLQGFGPYNELATVVAPEPGLQDTESAWSYEQAVCPGFPEHVVLEYSRRQGVGDVSLFSVVIPRGAGHIRVIPVRRRSYTLWTPAASNALTVNDFNHLVKEGSLSPDWLTTGLCYAALAGGHVSAALQASEPAEEHYPLYVPARLTVSRWGGAQVLFADVSHREKATDWTLIFAQDGRLLKVRRSAERGLVEKSVPGTATEVQGVPAKESTIEVTKPGR